VPMILSLGHRYLNHYRTLKLLIPCNPAGLSMGIDTYSAA